MLSDVSYVNKCFSFRKKWKYLPKQHLLKYTQDLAWIGSGPLTPWIVLRKARQIVWHGEIWCLTRSIPSTRPTMEYLYITPPVTVGCTAVTVGCLARNLLRRIKELNLAWNGSGPLTPLTPWIVLRKARQIVRRREMWCLTLSIPPVRLTMEYLYRTPPVTMKCIAVTARNLLRRVRKLNLAWDGSGPLTPWIVLRKARQIVIRRGMWCLTLSIQPVKLTMECLHRTPPVTMKCIAVTVRCIARNPLRRVQKLDNLTPLS